MSTQSFTPIAKWYWADDFSSSGFSEYQPSDAQALEAHFHTYKSTNSQSNRLIKNFSVTATPFTYTIDLASFTQINNTTQKKRDIKRVQIDWVLDKNHTLADQSLYNQLEYAYTNSATNYPLIYQSMTYQFNTHTMTMEPDEDSMADSISLERRLTTTSPSPPQTTSQKQSKPVNASHLYPQREVLRMTTSMMRNASNSGTHSSNNIQTHVKAVTNYSTLQKDEYENLKENCPICLESLSEPQSSDDAVVSICSGRSCIFHLNCLCACFDKEGMFLKCPMCSKTYGIRKGTMPEGTMTIERYPNFSCAGFTCGTIQITYHFPNGTQRKEHPNTGCHYTGTSRTAYLPDNKEGRYVLDLFKIAWERRLLFTVGKSITTGRDNCVVWNGIHHKTSPDGGFSNFGYPDETYFARVTQECKDKGVVLDRELEYETSTHSDRDNSQDFDVSSSDDDYQGNDSSSSDSDGL